MYFRAMARPVFHSLKVADVRKETADCVSISFEIPQDLVEAYRFTPGQYLTLRATIDGQDVRRSYSISSGSDDGECRVAVKKVENGLFSTWANEQLKKGDELQVMTPMGSFCPELDSTQSKHYLLIGAGSGITPLISIAKSVLVSEPKSEVSLIYGNRHFQQIIFRDELEDLKDLNLGRFRVFHVLSGEPNDIALFHGRIDNGKIEGFLKTFLAKSKVDSVFLCGPQEMTENAKQLFLSSGMEADQVHAELFNTAQPMKKQAEKKEEDTSNWCEVSVIMDGQQTDFKMHMDYPVLDAAQKAGMDIPFSCKGGMCCTCRAKVLEGKAEMLVNYALEPGEVQDGYVLTCQAVPKSSKLVVDFDQ
jgi:ring-1,2-phenylacetyl-CoA epoxidase subunit PaaE